MVNSDHIFRTIPGMERKMLPRMEFRKLNPLQTLLLVFVKFGLPTPYDLISRAAMSVGLTSPGLKRMEEAGLVTSTLGPRKRMEYAVTEKGAEELRKSLGSGRPFSWLLGRYETYESTPRAILLAWATSGLDEALRCAEDVQEELKFQAQQQEKEADKIRDTMLRPGNLFHSDGIVEKGALLAAAYQWLKAVCDAESLKMKAEAMKNVIPRLSELPASPHILQDAETFDHEPLRNTPSY